MVCKEVFGPEPATYIALMNNPRLALVNPAAMAPPINNSYSNGVKVAAGNLLFVAGQVALDVDGRMVGVGDPAAQMEQASKNIQAVCEAIGATLQYVVKLTVYVTDMRLLALMGPARKRFFGEHRPASLALQVAGLFSPDMVVEVEAVVAVP